MKIIKKMNKTKEKMNNEKEILSTISHYLKELEVEAYGERKHGNKEMPPNLYHFLKYTEELYRAVYSLSEIEGQEYMVKERLNMIYDVDREVNNEINVLIKEKTDQDALVEALPNILLKIQNSISDIIQKI